MTNKKIKKKRCDRGRTCPCAGIHSYSKNVWGTVAAVATVAIIMPLDCTGSSHSHSEFPNTSPPAKGFWTTTESDSQEEEKPATSSFSATSTSLSLPEMIVATESSNPRPLTLRGLAESWTPYASSNENDDFLIDESQAMDDPSTQSDAIVSDNEYTIEADDENDKVQLPELTEILGDFELDWSQTIDDQSTQNDASDSDDETTIETDDENDDVLLPELPEILGDFELNVKQTIEDWKTEMKNVMLQSYLRISRPLPDEGATPLARSILSFTWDRTDTITKSGTGTTLESKKISDGEESINELQKKRVEQQHPQQLQPQLLHMQPFLEPTTLQEHHAQSGAATAVVTTIQSRSDPQQVNDSYQKKKKKKKRRKKVLVGSTALSYNDLKGGGSDPFINRIVHLQILHRHLRFIAIALVYVAASSLALRMLTWALWIC